MGGKMGEAVAGHRPRETQAWAVWLRAASTRVSNC